MTMADVAGWIALIATCTAATMTAANLGTRVTGWGFVVFTVGSIAWIAVGLASGMAQLLWSNLFLSLVNMLGIWRWLGHKARVEDSAAAAVERSRRQAGPTLFSASSLTGMAVVGRDGAALAHVVEALADCGSGRLTHLIVSVGGIGGIGETLHKLPWTAARMGDAEVRTDLDPAGLGRLEPAERAAA